MLFPKVSLSGDEMNAMRGPSPGLWRNFPLADVKSDPNIGIFFFDDFGAYAPHADNSAGAVTEKNGPYSTFLSQSATGFAPSLTVAGGILGAALDGDGESCVIHQYAVPFKIANAGKPFAMEARVAKSDIANTKFEMFVGLCEKITPTAAVPVTNTAATLADQNLVGFYSHESDGDVFNVDYKANGVTAVELAADIVTLVANTYVKLGMWFDGIVLRFYVDGEEVVDADLPYTIPAAAGTDFPNDVTMGLTWAIRNAAASGGTGYIDWWMAAQLL